jgi:DoxX-like family
MNQRLKKFAIPGLRWTVGVVVLLESIHFTLSSSAGRELAKAGLPHWIRPALGGSEAIAALLFLVPAANLIGGYLLLIVFTIAVAIHFLLGEFNVGAIFVYGMAVVVCTSHRNNAALESSHDR